MSRLPDVEGDKPKRQRFKRYPIGFLHIDIAEVQTAEGKLYLFVAIDRTSKYAVAQLVGTADRRTAWEFLQHMLEAVPYQVHTIVRFQVSGKPGAVQWAFKWVASIITVSVSWPAAASSVSIRAKTPNRLQRIQRF